MKDENRVDLCETYLTDEYVAYLKSIQDEDGFCEVDIFPEWGPVRIKVEFSGKKEVEQWPERLRRNMGID